MVVRIFLSLIALIFSVAEAKVISCSPNFYRAKQWVFCARMGFAKDALAYYEAQIQFRSGVLDSIDSPKASYEINMLVFTNGVWESSIQDRRDSITCSELEELAQINQKIKIGKNVEEAEQYKYWNEQRIQFVPQFFYFVFADCQQTTVEDGVQLLFDAMLKIRNDGHEFSEEEAGVMLLFSSALAVFLAVMGANVYRYLKDIFKYEMPESPVMVLVMSIAFQISSIVFQLVNEAIYSYNGKGFFLFEIISNVQQIASQIVMAFLLLMLAWGWTITKHKLDSNDLELALPVGGFVLLLNGVIGILLYLDNEESHKFHTYQGLQGILLCVFRLCIFGGFIFGVHYTKQNLKPKEKRDFLTMLMVVGSLYFLGLPVTVWLCGFVSPFNQQTMLHVCFFAKMFFSYLILLYELTAEKSQYKKASYKSESILPHNKDL